MPFLPPGHIDEERHIYELSVRIGDRVRQLRYSASDGQLAVELDGRATKTDLREAERITRRVFRLDQDLAPFYAMIANDERLSWAIGAGRLIASPTVFEDVIKTICTTNTTWAGTRRMIGALVELAGGAFPDAALLAKTPERWFKDVARMGYRGAYVKAIAKDVHAGRLDLEALLPHRVEEEEAKEDTVEVALRELPGVGPYAAAHIMQLLGFHHQLVLDSATRPKYLELSGKKRASDKTIVRAFKPYGPYAGLAFWLYITRDWIEELPFDSRAALV
ncbi:MAG TPA: Fe-S cluster assembly protein HesB [Verrucomicrobiae bacterium]|nr:Fe-S cluster assembly protein HesB [Verrucomicrobiae bacterium]